MNEKQIGSFEINSGQIIVSDPSYELELPEKGKHFQGIISDIAQGHWIARANYTNTNEIITLEVTHESMPSRKDLLWERAEFNGAIDSAMIGIFDKKCFRNDSTITEVPKEHFGNDIWYSACCMSVQNDFNAGIMPGGIILGTTGDGQYSTEIGKSDGKVIGIRVILN